MSNFGDTLTEQQLEDAFKEVTSALEPDGDLSGAIEKYIPNASEGTAENNRLKLISIRGKMIEDRKALFALAMAYGTESGGEAVNAIKTTAATPAALPELEASQEEEAKGYDASGKSIVFILRELGTKKKVSEALPAALKYSEALKLCRPGTGKTQSREELVEALRDINDKLSERTGEIAKKYGTKPTEEAVTAYEEKLQEDLFTFDFLCSIYKTETPELAIAAIYGEEKSK